MSRPFTKLSDSFKILRDNLNTTSYNVGDPVNLLTYGDSDVVMAINEIERVFDASAGEILYPTGNALQGETQTRLLISTAQASGTDIQFNVGANFNVNAVGDINLDAGGANINFLDDSVARFNFTLGGTNVVDVTGILDLNISSNLDADIAGNSVLTTTGSQTQEGTTLNLDFSGDITLDADGNDIIFKNGAGGDQVTHTLLDNAKYTIAAPDDYTIDAVGDIVLDAGGDNITLKDAGTTRIGYTLGATNTITTTGNLTNNTSGAVVDSAASYTGTFTGAYATTAGGNQTATVGGNYVLDANGDITLDANGNDIILRDGASDRIKHTLGATNTTAVTGNYTVDASGDIVLDAGGNDLDIKGAGTTRFAYGLGASNTIDVTGNLTQAVGGNLTQTIAGAYSDSATGAYHIGATGAVDIVSTSTLVTSSKAQTHTSNGAYNVNVTGNALIDASGDITLDADGNDIFFKNGAGGDTVTHTLADNGLYTVQAPSGYVVNAVGDIVLDADGGDIVLRDDGVQFGKMTNSLKRLHIYSGSTQALHFDSSANATFTQDLTVNGNTDLDGTLNVDGATTLNGHVDLGNATSDNISIIGRVDTNIVPDADDTYDFGTSALQWRHAFFDGTVTTDSLVTDSADIANFNVVSNTISNPNAVTLDGGNAIHLDTHTGSLTMKKAGTTRLAYTLAANNVLNATGSLTTNATTLIKDSATTSHTTVAGTSIVHTAGTTLTNTSGGAMQQTSGGNWTATVTGAAKIAASTTITLDAAGDIILDAAGDDVILKDAGTEYGRFKHAGANQLGIYSNGILTATLNDSDIVFNNDVNIENDLDVDRDLNVDRNTTLNGNVDLGNATGDTISFLGRVDTNIVPSTDGTRDLGSSSLEMRHGFFDGTVTTDGLVADSADIGNFNIIANAISNSNAVTLTTGALTATVTGNALIDASGDITLDADGNDIIFKNGAGGDTVTHTLANDATYKVIAPSTYTLDVNGDIVLDANGGDVYLKDNGTQFGRFQNSSNQLDIYSGATLAVAMDASKVEIHGRAFFVDSGVNTVAQNIAGSINEIHTQLDSAVGEILVNKGNIATNDTELTDHLSRLDSDATFLQSNLGRIDTNSANIATNVSNITAVNTLVGTLNTLDSSAPGGFFKGINNDSIVKALNELATRTVLIYDESGTLLN